MLLNAMMKLRAKNESGYQKYIFIFSKLRATMKKHVLKVGIIDV